jgi:FecR protein
MKRLSWLLASLSLAFVWVLAPPRGEADQSHARIVRLSLVEGDVRFAREFHKDSMEDAKAVWEVAPLNLPLRQGYALATDANSRAEVEFENGAMAFLSANTLVEFYDLSLDDGALITRLILRQGSAIFYVHPGRGDYFSVTGGDFSVEANSRTRFRLDNFDDGSNVAVELGQVNVLRNKVPKPLEKGQSYSININDNSAPALGRAPEYDDFDKWVSGRIDSVATATTYSNQYVNSPDYTSGFADLYNYGSFYNIPGYGYGWQPYGAGLGWNPFAFGGWYSDPLLGWNFIGSAPWGWLPYHFGGWAFSPIYGWVWMPTGFGYGGYGYGGSPLLYHPITAVFVRSGTTTGVVPMNPADERGKAPLNLAHGVYPLQGNTLGASMTPAAGENWSVIKNPPRDTLTATAPAVTTQPTRVSRTILSGRAVTLSRESSIVYDAGQHRFVNNGNAVKAPEEEAKAATGSSRAATASNAVAAVRAERSSNTPTVAHGATSAVRPRITPPNPPSNGGSSHSYSGAVWQGDASNSSNAANSSHTTSSAPAGHSGGGHH